MAKDKKHKKIPKQQNLRLFFQSRSNIIIIAIGLLVIGLGVQRAISRLMLKSDLVYCGENDIRHLYLDPNGVGFIHHDALIELWICGIVLGILAGYIIFRNKYLKWFLILSIIALALYVGAVLFGESFNRGLTCLDF